MKNNTIKYGYCRVDFAAMAFRNSKQRQNRRLKMIKKLRMSLFWLTNSTSRSMSGMRGLHLISLSWFSAICSKMQQQGGENSTSFPLSFERLPQPWKRTCKWLLARVRFMRNPNSRSKTATRRVHRSSSSSLDRLS